jgi:DNA topoisomerase-1
MAICKPPAAMRDIESNTDTIRAGAPRATRPSTIGSQAAAKRNITQAIERVAARLGNTKAVCRKCYIHPAVIDAYLDHSLIEVLEQRAEEELRTALPALPAEEAAVLALLQQRMEKQLDGKRRRVRRAAARPPRRRPAERRS